MKNILVAQMLGVLFALSTMNAQAQQLVHGKVTNTANIAIFSAKVKAPQARETVYTDSIGNFSFTTDSLFDYIIVEAFGYSTDTLIIGDINKPIMVVLNAVNEIDKVSIKGEAANSFIGRRPEKTEIITHGELKKAACCDLAGCFETQGTVKSVTTNVITNSAELRILGLSGVYNQVLTDGMPMIQGLSYTYGISAMPGPAVFGIFVSKGTNSVLQGYESMVGQINVVPKSGITAEKMLLNAYVNSFGENQYNATYSMQKKKWNNYTAVQLVNPAQEWDRNNDSFTDVTRTNRLLLYNKLQYGQDKTKGLQATIGFKINKEKRVGGQLGFNDKTNAGSSSIYGQVVDYVQPEMYIKTKWLLNPKERIEVMASGIYHNQHSFFGPVQYNAEQKQLYANAQYDRDWAAGDNNLKTGLSFRNLQIEENIAFKDTSTLRTYDGKYLKDEKVLGVFAENIWNWRGGIYQLIAGGRADYHNQFGLQMTPRAMFKYDVTEKGTLRFSAGTGWRTVNMFAENIGLLVSTRDIIFKEILQPEKSVNMGLNWVQNFKKGWFQGYFTTDFYQTRFQNQFFPDYDSDAKLAIIQNFTGTSVSNGFQFDLVTSYKNNLEFKFTYNYLDVYRVINKEKVLLPFNSKNRYMAAVSYKTKNKKWQADLNSHLNGKMRLPNTENNPDAFKRASYSNVFGTLNLQLTRKWKKVEAYAGVENILNYTQKNPIINAQNPFDPYFDTSFIWGPVKGRELFLGIRWMPFGE